VPVNLAFKMVKSIDTFLETLFLDVIFLVWLTFLFKNHDASCKSYL
jgi:hypothetical protein